MCMNTNITENLENAENAGGAKCFGYPVKVITKDDYPLLLKTIGKLPARMYVCGDIPDDDHKFLCVIGSRNNSEYGRQVCKDIIFGLQGAPVVIISGLAIGIDSLAHEFAIEAGLKTVAIPGSGLDRSVMYPSSRRELAKKILDSGGAIVSPFEMKQSGARWTFPVRNSIMAGMSHAVLMIEAREKSGTLITAGNALDFNRDLLAVPGSIFSDLSKGTNQQLRSGATAVTCALDVLEALGISRGESSEIQTKFNLDRLGPDEARLLSRLSYPKLRDELINELHIDASDLNALLSSLELVGAISEEDGLIMKIWRT